MKYFTHAKLLKEAVNTRLGVLKLSCVLAGALIASSFTGCKTKTLYDAPAVYGFKGKGIVPPPGMVYVPSGTIMYKSSTDNEGTAARKVSLSPFFIDATEVTNRQYREFVSWVADSIIITDYLKDDRYFLKPEKNSTTTARLIDWSKVEKEGPLWQSSDPNISSKIMGILVVEENGKNVLNKDLLKYSLSYFQAGGENANKFVTESISVIPQKTVWMDDFPNSQMSFMAINYADHRSYDNYPVVGVTWKQARAFADWRGKAAAALLHKNAYLKSYQLTFNLPTEAQWQYAASGKRNADDMQNGSLLSFKDRRDKEKLLVNFKQGEGNYTQDGSTFTLPVKSYSPNEFGLYNMAGNVAEWTLDAFSPSASEFVHDLNPVLLYDASDSDPAVMKRKVVRGGSWKDNAELLDVNTRNYEMQDVAHSYIGFRCVMPAPELLSEQVRTRTRAARMKSSEKSSGRASRAVSNVTTKGE